MKKFFVHHHNIQMRILPENPSSIAIFEIGKSYRIAMAYINVFKKKIIILVCPFVWPLKIVGIDNFLFNSASNA